MTRNTVAFFLFLAANQFVFCVQLQAQSPAAGKAQAQFKKLDRDGDQKISAAEADGGAWFKIADKDNDGFVTQEEGREFAAGRGNKGKGQDSKKSDAKKPANSKESLPASVTVKTGIGYSDSTNDVLQSLDLYAPKDAKGLPVMIYVHGGGWSKGDKSAVGIKPEYFTSQGYVFVSLNYRFVPSVDIMTQLQDSANGIGWVHKHIAVHGGDPNRLHLIGHSAGAHHVAILATNEKFLKNSGVELSSIKSVVELDTQALNIVELMPGTTNQAYSQAFGKDAEVWKQISPLHNLAKGKHIPPFFLVVADNIAPKLAQANAFQKLLVANDVRCEFVEAPEHDHGSLNQAIGDRDDKVTQAMQRFHESLTSK